MEGLWPFKPLKPLNLKNQSLTFKLYKAERDLKSHNIYVILI